MNYSTSEEKRISNKIYYHKNREQILKQLREKRNCPCGGRYTRGTAAGHYKTNIHKNYLVSIQDAK